MHENEIEDARIALRSSDANLKMNINGLQTRKELLTWYLDLNDGGTVHTKEELDKVKEMLEGL